MKFAFDRAASARSFDDNGFMRVASSHITKATVNPYYGREIPGWRDAGLDPERVYYGLRDPRELQKSIGTWEGLPLHIEHHPDSADDPEIRTRVGAVGRARWANPYVDAPLYIWNQQAIDAIEDGSFRELSCAYRYTPDFTPGQYEGVDYDFIMRNIRGNHVALVEEGRAGADVLVADAALDGKKDDGWITAENGKKIHFKDGEIDKGNIGQADWDSPEQQQHRRDKINEALGEIAAGKPESIISELRNDFEQYGGTNDVTIVLGNKKKGLIHIEKRHGKESVGPVLEAVANGKIYRFEKANKTIAIQKDGYEAILSLDEHGEKKTWLLTGYDLLSGKKKAAKDERGKLSQDTRLHNTEPSRSRFGMGASTAFDKNIGIIFFNVNTQTGGIMSKFKKWFKGGQDSNPEVEREEVDLAQAIIDLHKVDPKTGEIVDITEDEDKAEEIRKIIGEISGKLDPEELKKLTDALGVLAYSKATGDSGEPKKSAMDEEAKKAMDSCGLDADDPEISKAFAEGVKYGESLEKDPGEREKLDKEHEANGMKKAMDACGVDAENPQESKAFAEGVKYGEKLERDPEEAKKLDREHESEGAKKAMDSDKSGAIAAILDKTPSLTDEQRKALEPSLLALFTPEGAMEIAAQDSALRFRAKAPRPLLATDAAVIQARAVAEAQDNMRKIASAVRDVRPLVGELDMLAFDSANDVYGYALEQCGVDKRKYEKSAWRGMVDMLRRERAGLNDRRLAQDSKPVKLDGPFAGLASISLGD